MAMLRRRSHLEVMVCALLVAVLAVQPASGEPKGKVVGSATLADAALLKGARTAPAKSSTRLTRSAAKARPAQAQGAPAGAGPPVDPPAATPGENGNPHGGPPAHAAAPEDNAPAGTPSPNAAPHASPTPAAPVATPVPEDNAGPTRGAGATPDSARGGTASGKDTTAPTASEQPQTDSGTIAPSAPTSGQVTPQPTAQSTPLPDAGNASLRGSARRTSLSAGPRTAAGGQSDGAADAPLSALSTPLVTPAVEAITRVRPTGGAETSQPGPSADDIPPLQGVANSGASDSSVGEVLVEWAKYALIVLALLVLALGINAVIASARTRRLERQRERLMEDIGLLQAALLPAVPPRLGALLTTVAYRPADGPAAGGDFYDAFPLADGRVGLLLGDVSGHGRAALAKTTLVRFTVRAHLEAGLSPREALAITGRSLDGRLSDDFATVIAAVHDPVKGTLTYASAGHPPPIVVGPPRHEPVTVSSAPPIGVGFPTGQRQTVLPMPEGSSVMIYSDGLLEARIDGVPLGPERLTAWVADLGPDATAKAVLDRVVEKADRVPDDLAAVLLHASPGATAPAARIEQLKLDVLDMDGPDLDGFLRACGVAEVDRLIAGRRVSELLAVASGVIVEVRTGEHPMVSVAPIGDDAGLATRPSARAR